MKVIGNEPFYTAPEVCRILEHNGPERLRQWIDRGYVKPDIVSPGTGSPHRFCKESVYSLQLFTAVANMGFNRYVAGCVISFVSKEAWRKIEDVNEAWLVCFGEIRERERWAFNWLEYNHARIYLDETPNLQHYKVWGYMMYYDLKGMVERIKPKL